MSVERVVDSADRLGECPLWDERGQALWWVDIFAPAIKRFDGKPGFTSGKAAASACSQLPLITTKPIASTTAVAIAQGGSGSGR